MWFLIKQIHSSRCPDWKMAVKKATLSLHNLRIHFRRQIRSQQSHKSPFEVNIYFKNKTETKKCASAISNATNEIMKVWKKRRTAVPLDRNLLFCWPRRAVYFQKCCSVRQMCCFIKKGHCHRWLHNQSETTEPLCFCCTGQLQTFFKGEAPELRGRKARHRASRFIIVLLEAKQQEPTPSHLRDKDEE